MGRAVGVDLGTTDSVIAPTEVGRILDAGGTSCSAERFVGREHDEVQRPPLTTSGTGPARPRSRSPLSLARRAGAVHLVTRHDDLAREMSCSLADRIVSTPRIHVRASCEVAELRGHLSMEQVLLHDLRSGERPPGATALLVLTGTGTEEVGDVRSRSVSLVHEHLVRIGRR